MEKSYDSFHMSKAEREALAVLGYESQYSGIVDANECK